MAVNVTTNVFEEYQTGEDTWASGIETMDINKSGQFGLLPMIGGLDGDKNIHSWMYNQSYHRRDLIAIVLETPKGFDFLPEPKQWHTAVKAMFEVHAKTIDGLDSSLTVDSTETDSGLSGAKFKEPSNVTRAESSVTLGGITEKYGIPFEILLDTWIRVLIQSPDTKAPLITTLPDADKITVYGPEYWTATVMFIEPDVLLRKAVHGWFTSNLYPGANPDIVGKKDKTAGRELKEISIDFGGFSIPSTNRRVMELANTILSNLKLYTRTPDDILLPATDVAANLKGTAGTQHYEHVDNPDAPVSVYEQ